MDVWWVETGLLDGVFELDGNVDEFMSFGHLGNWVVSKGAQELKDCGKTCFDGEGAVSQLKGIDSLSNFIIIMFGYGYMIDVQIHYP